MELLLDQLSRAIDLFLSSIKTDRGTHSGPYGLGRTRLQHGPKAVQSFSLTKTRFHRRGVTCQVLWSPSPSWRYHHYLLGILERQMKNFGNQIQRWYVWGPLPAWKSDKATYSSKATIRAARKAKLCLFLNSALYFILNFNTATTKKSGHTMWVAIFALMLSLSALDSATGRPSCFVMHRTGKKISSEARAPVFRRLGSACSQCLSFNKITNAVLLRTWDVSDGEVLYALERFAVAVDVIECISHAWTGTHTWDDCDLGRTWVLLIRRSRISKTFIRLILRSRSSWR